jgi:hypothetical protein
MSFLDYSYLDKDLHFSKVKSANALWNVQNCHINNHSKNNFYNFKVLALNNVSDIRGSFLDFPIQSVDDFVNKSYILNMTIKNNNNTTTVNIPNMLHNIKNIEIIHQGISKWNSANCYESVIKNTLFLDSVDTLHQNLLSFQGIVNSSNVGYIYALGTLLSVNWMGEICLPISNLNFYRPKLQGELIIRIHFNSYFDTGTKDADVAISNVFMYINAVKVSKDCVKKWMSEPILHYPYNAFMYRQYSLNNGITSGVEFSQQLTSYQYHTSTFFVWISKNNDTKQNFFSNYDIKSLRLTNSNNENVLNNMVLDSNLLSYLNSKYHFDDSGSSFFKNSKVYCVTVSTDIYQDINFNAYNGSIKIKNDFLLYITPEATESSACKLNIMFISPSIIELSNNNFECIASGF